MKKEIKSGMIFSLTSLVVFGLAGIVYASTVSSGQLLTADLFNEKMVPSKAVMAFYDTSCPTGWSKADGIEHELNLENEFIRGASSSLAVGTKQLATHVGQYTGRGSSYADINLWNYDSSQMGNKNTSFANSISNSNNGNLYPTYAFRPRNVALLFCIKD